jgi:hypothetical protein
LGIRKLLHSSVVKFLDRNPEAKERNNGYIVHDKAVCFQVTFTDGGQISSPQSRFEGGKMSLPEESVGPGESLIERVPVRTRKAIAGVGSG